MADQGLEGEDVEALRRRCALLEKQIESLQLDREHLLGQVVQERERANAMFLGFPPLNFAQPSPIDVSSPSGPKPLRYRLVDSLNDAVKRRLPIMHRLARQAGG